jgi:hypothetical protein
MLLRITTSQVILKNNFNKFRPFRIGWIDALTGLKLPKRYFLISICSFGLPGHVGQPTATQCDRKCDCG